MISAVSYWEALIKQRRGKLSFDLDDADEVRGRVGFRLLGVSVMHLRRLASRPVHHRDPFDHLLIAQAIEEGASLVTANGVFTDYPVELIRCG